MAENSKIEWTHHTFNPWIGCTAVSAGCDNCYAATLMDTRLGRVKWGPGKPRVLTSDANWRMPITWNRKAEAAGERHRVFCASLADIFDNEVPELWFEDVKRLISSTPNLDWLLLTKRPHLARIKCEQEYPPDNVWIGATTENQATYDARIHDLIATPTRTRFLSCEPLISPLKILDNNIIDWVIVGGESGPNARHMDPDWARSIRDQCQQLGIAFFMKQMSGRTAVERQAIPEDLMIREYPR